MIATAESCTGGLIIGRLTDVPGSSDAVDRGFVTHSNAAKGAMLGIRPETLAAHGAVSEEIAAEMAAGALARSQAAIAVAVTGIAGPGGSEHKPEGASASALPMRRASGPKPSNSGALWPRQCACRDRRTRAGAAESRAGLDSTASAPATSSGRVSQPQTSGPRPDHPAPRSAYAATGDSRSPPPAPAGAGDRGWWRKTAFVSTR